MARSRHNLVMIDGEQLSSLIASNAMLDERVTNLIEEFKRERLGATEHRRDLRAVINSLSESVRNLTATVAELKPLVDDYRTRRDEARGAAKLGIALKGFVLAACTAAGAFVHRIWPG